MKFECQTWYYKAADADHPNTMIRSNLTSALLLVLVGRSWQGIVSWAGTRILELPPIYRLGPFECAGLDVELPLEVGAQALISRTARSIPRRASASRPTTHRDLLEHVSSWMTSETIVNMVPRGTTSSDEPRHQSLQKAENSKGHGGCTAVCITT